MQFELSTDLNKGLQVIDFNYENLKTAIQDQVTKYQGIIVLKEGIQDAKDDRAKLNKLSAALDDARKNIKTEYLKPYNEFEAKLKELIALVDVPCKAIDDQIKSFDQKVKDDKKTSIQAYFDANVGDLEGLLTLDKLWDAKWLNAGTKMPEIEKTISAAIGKLRADIRVIKISKLPFEQEVLNVLVSTLDMSAALAKKNQLELQAERLAQITVEEIKPLIVVAKPVPEYYPEPAPSATPAEIIEAVQDLQQIDFRVWVNPVQKAALKQFLLNNGIKYGGVN